MMGDFNARVGAGQRGDEWAEVRGPHGYGVANSSGD